MTFLSEIALGFSVSLKTVQTRRTLPSSSLSSDSTQVGRRVVAYARACLLESPPWALPDLPPFILSMDLTNQAGAFALACASLFGFGHSK